MPQITIQRVFGDSKLYLETDDVMTMALLGAYRAELMDSTKWRLDLVHRTVSEVLDNLTNSGYQVTSHTFNDIAEFYTLHKPDLQPLD